MEAAGPTAEKFIEWCDLVEYIAFHATANTAVLLVLFCDDYVLGSIYIFMTAVVLLRVRKICARSLDRSVDDRQISDLAMKHHGLSEIMVWTVWYCRFGKEKMRELSCHNSEMIGLTPDLLDSRQALERLAISIMFLERCWLKPPTKLSMHSID
ncbi:MAG: hypothetical protein ABR907_17150 [Terracidiphilus sp.]